MSAEDDGDPRQAMACYAALHRRGSRRSLAARVRRRGRCMPAVGMRRECCDGRRAQGAVGALGRRRCTRLADYAERAGRQARARAAQPVRDRSRQHGRSGAAMLADIGRAECRAAARHVPHEHRGEGHPGRDPARRPAYRSSSTPVRATAARRARIICRGATSSRRCARRGYDGPVVIEAFTPKIKEIARAVSLWRPLAESEDALARNGLAHLRRVFGKNGAQGGGGVG